MPVTVNLDSWFMWWKWTKSMFGLFSEVLDLGLHLSRPKQQFYPLFKLLEFGFNLCTSTFFPLVISVRPEWTCSSKFSCIFSLGCQVRTVLWALAASTRHQVSHPFHYHLHFWSLDSTVYTLATNCIHATNYPLALVAWKSLALVTNLNCQHYKSKTLHYTTAYQN